MPGGDIVPIVEPEVLMDGDHDIDAATRDRMGAEGDLPGALLSRVKLEGMVLKPNMVIAGKKAAKQAPSPKSPRRP